MDYRTPVYVQLRELLKEKIEEGEFLPGEAIPSERELAAAYGLNRLTVRNAVAALVNEGLLKRVQGKGTFVTKPRIERDLYTLSGFGSTMLDRGVKPASKLLHTGKRKAGKKYAGIFGISEEDYIFNIMRLRLGDDEPIALEDTYIPYGLIPNIEELDFQTFSLYECFRLNDISLAEASQTLTLARVEETEARLLKVPDGCAVFLFDCISRSSDGSVIEFTKSYTRGDKCSFLAELK